jgi:hypothetical protein
MRGDDRYYFISGPSYHVNEVNSTVEANYTATPKNLDDLKKQQTAQVNQTAYSLLVQSDWMVVKSVETSTPVPADWTAYRASVRATADAQRTAIAATTTVQELQDLAPANWPNDPNYIPPSEPAPVDPAPQV